MLLTIEKSRSRVFHTQIMIMLYTTLARPVSTW